MSDEITELLAERGASWGDAIKTHVRIAQVWSAIFGCYINSGQVALAMEGLKLVRASINPDDPDSFKDGQAYNRIAELLYGHRETL